MGFYDTVKNRRSIRAYKDMPIEDAVLERVLEAGLLAPSWCNRQCWRIIVVKDEKKREMLSAMLDNHAAACFKDAPVAIAICAEASDSGRMEGKEYYLVDCAIAFEHMVLAAQSEGLGTCWIGAFSEYPVRNILDIPKEIKIVALTPLGYPNEAPEPRPRRSREETIYYDAWRK